MPPRHRMLAALVAALWGGNFLAIDASLRQFPPFFLVALRFAVIAIPTVLLVPRPAVPLRWLVGYGVGFGTLQFLFLYWAMAAGLPPGLASLVLQSSAPFTVALGAVLFGQRVGRAQLAGLAVAAGGLAVVGWQYVESAPIGPFLLVLAGGLGWAFGNLATAQAKAPNPLHLTLWMAAVPPVPMLAVSLAVEGPQRIAASFGSLAAPDGLRALAGLAYTVLVATVLGSGIWSWLMSRHPAGVVAPFSMLVPLVGLVSAALVVGEPLPPAKLVGALVCVGGVLLATRTGRAPRRPSARPADQARRCRTASTVH